VGIGEPENSCQPTNIVDCLIHLIVDSKGLLSIKVGPLSSGPGQFLGS